MEQKTNFFSDNLILLRTEANLSQDTLSEMLSVSRQAISNWERSKSQPDIETLIKLADIFKVSIDDLLTMPDDHLFKHALPEAKRERSTHKIGIGLFYAAWLFFALGLFLVIGLLAKETLIWYVAGIGCTSLFFVTGLLTHALIYLFKK